MAAVPGPSVSDGLQGEALVQAFLMSEEVKRHRRLAAALGHCRPGFCMSEAWDVSQVPLDGSFDLDGAVLEALLRQGGPPQAPPPHASPRDGGSALHDYLYPPDSGAPPLSAQRLAEETAGAVYGPGNIVGNTVASLAGAMQGLGERNSARALADGIRAIVAGRASTVLVAPGMELYNAAQGRQRPRVRLRVRGAMVPLVRQSVAVTSAAAAQWRVNGPGNAASLGVGRMSQQQMRNMALHAGEARLPGALRWASGLKGGGVLTFAPALLLDSYGAIETDLSGSRHFNGKKFLVSQARSQSGNAVGFVGGMFVGLIVGAAGAVGAPVVLAGLVGGIFCQVIWNWTGAADATADATEKALR